MDTRGFSQLDDDMDSIELTDDELEHIVGGITTTEASAILDNTRIFKRQGMSVEDAAEFVRKTIGTPGSHWTEEMVKQMEKRWNDVK